MARLTPFSRLLIALVIVAGVYFAARTFFPNFLGKSSSDTAASSTTQNDGGTYQPDNGAPAGSAGTANQTDFERSAFNYSPPLPVNGKLKGVVELGATGFNSFIIRADNQKNWKKEKSAFGASLVYEKMTSDQDVKDGLKNYISEMIAYGVNPRDIHFVISSGAKKVGIVDKIIATLTSMKYQVNTVTPSQEGAYAHKSAVPSEYSGRAFAVDIGSGNTKIAWRDRGQITALETYGAKYTQNNTSAATVATDVKSKASQIPSAYTQTCFIIGGVPYEIAKKIRNGDERYTVLPAPADVKPEGDKQIAGLNIYNSVAQATGCKQFVFDWDANFTIGFLLEL